MDGRNLEEILILVARLSSEQGMSRPLRLRVEFADALDNIDVPFSLVRQHVAKHAQPPAPAMTTTTPVSRAPVDADEAILVALFYAGSRRTGPELDQDVQHHWPDRWSSGTISNEATRMARSNGKLSHHAKDPNDGYGKGYGLKDWDKTPAETS